MPVTPEFNLATAYVDASALLAVALWEPAARLITQRLATFDMLASAGLLDAETRSAFARHGMDIAGALPYTIEWIYPDRPLTPEIVTALRVGYLRGAGLWHIAVALYLDATISSELVFITLDERQRAVAAGLGLST